MVNRGKRHAFVKRCTKFFAPKSYYSPAQEDKMEDKFTQGFIAACAITLRNHGCDTEVRDTLVCLGPAAHSISMLRKLGVDDYDINILRPVILDLQARKRRENTMEGREKLRTTDALRSPSAHAKHTS
jgi:hypothetical protein